MSEKEVSKGTNQPRKKIGEPSNFTTRKPAGSKHKVGYLFRKTKVKSYLLDAFLLFTKWEVKTEVKRDEFKKKLKEFLKR